MTTADEITADEPVSEMWNPLDPALAEDPIRGMPRCAGVIRCISNRYWAGGLSPGTTRPARCCGNRAAS